MFCKTLKVLILGAALISVFVCGVQESYSAERKHTIVVDPAHGGQDNGVKITDKISEKDITLAIALALQKEMAPDSNIQIVLMRDSDKTMSIDDRRKEISRIKPDLFLSIHINAGFGRNASGFELYYPGFKEADTQKKQSKSGTKDIGNKYLNDSVRFAQIIQKNLDSLFPRKGRGLREADSPVVEGLPIPAVIVELGFASNPEERKKLLSTNTQSDLARVLAKSVKSFF